MPAQSPAFDRLIKLLDELIAEVTAAHLDQTALLLQMARIDLVVRTNDISEEEFELFLYALEHKQHTANHIDLPEHKSAG